jgi:hypothetical protein
MSMLKTILQGNNDQPDDLNASVRKMRLLLAAWLRQRLKHLARDDEGDMPATALPDLAGSSDLGGGEDIWG